MSFKEPEIYQDLDRYVIYKLGQGMFYYLADSKNQDWKYVKPDTTHFDSLHQEIFRNNDFDSVTWEDIKNDVPPFPELPENTKPMQWSDNFDFKPKHVKEFQKTKELLKRSNNKLDFYVVLFEDRYETLHGDGKFLYVQDIVLNKNDVEAYIQKKNQDCHDIEYSYKSIRFLLENDQITCSNESNPSFSKFEHYNFLDILSKLENQLT